MAPKKLVMGASGFLGSHVVRELVARGDDVRVMLRESSSTRAIDDLDVERCYGDIFDAEAVRAAMTGCDVVFYCVVDTRAWLRDPAPLWRTNVDGLRDVLDVAAAAGLRRFVFTSSIATIGIVENGLATEEVRNNWLDRAGDYVRTRVVAEDLVFTYCAERGLPGVALCVANTYGPNDWQPTPHGRLVALAARGRLPFYIAGSAAEIVGVTDAARALVLAADRGRVGERYIVAERSMTAREICETACEAVHSAPPRFGVPLAAMYAFGFAGELVARVMRRDTQVTRLSVRLTHIMSPMDHGKAERELEWHPAPAPDAVADAARWFCRR